MTDNWSPAENDLNDTSAPAPAAVSDTVGVLIALLILVGVTVIHLTIGQRPEFYTNTSTLLGAFRGLFLLAGPPLAVFLALRSLGRRGVRTVPVFLTCFGTFVTLLTLLAVGRSLLG